MTLYNKHSKAHPTVAIKIVLFVILFCNRNTVHSQSDYYDYWNDRQDYYDYLDDLNDYYSTYEDYDPYDYYDLYDDYSPYEVNNSYEYYENSSYIGTNTYSQTRSTGRLSPSSNIGIFVDLDIFTQHLEDYLGSKAYIKERQTNSNPIMYRLSNGVTISCLMNTDYGKIHTLIISIPDGYNFDTYWDAVRASYYATGMYYAYDNYIDVMDIVEIKLTYENEYLLITTWYDEENKLFMTMITDNSERNMKVRSGCDPNYVGTCVPLLGNNLDCYDIKSKNFFVVGNDIHNFDGNGNGVCCEAYPTYKMSASFEWEKNNR